MNSTQDPNKRNHKRRKSSTQTHTIVTRFFFFQITSLKKNFQFFLLDVNFENLTFGLHIFYILNTYFKFHSNQILFIIQSINLFVMHNFRL